jgi:hypothetical protein
MSAVRRVERQAFLSEVRERKGVRCALGSMFASPRAKQSSIKPERIEHAGGLLDTLATPASIARMSWAEYWVVSSLALDELASELSSRLERMNRAGVPELWQGAVAEVPAEADVERVLHDFSWMPAKAAQYDEASRLFVMAYEADRAVPYASGSSDRG